MADIFLSYAHADREVAQRLVDGLEECGISVWWDRRLLPGQKVSDSISKELRRSSGVIALFSEASPANAWLADESALALELEKTLIPVLIHDVTLPLGLSHIQTASLIGWTGEVHDERFQTLLAGIRSVLGRSNDSDRETRHLKEEQRRLTRRAESLFQENLRSRTVVEHLALQGTGSYEHIDWSLHPKMNVLLGRNGYGKSFLLRGFIALLQHEDDRAYELLSTGSATVDLLNNGTTRTVRFEDEFFDEDDAVGHVPVLAIPDARFMNRSISTLGLSSENVGGSDEGRYATDLGRYGAWHFLRQQPYEQIIQTFLYGICLDYFEADQSFDIEIFDLIGNVVRALTDKSFAFERVERAGRDRFTLYVRTEGNEHHPIPIQKASQGTLSIIVMMGLIHDYLKALKPQSPPKRVGERAGIVFIDEVDAHLHPLWQQKVLTLLRESFPNVQFIVTAHSPLVVAGCFEDEVAVLRKQQTTPGFSVYPFPNDFIGWQPDEIYHKVFEVEDVDETYIAFNALLPFKKQIETEIAALSDNEKCSPEQVLELDHLEEQLYYIEKTEQKRLERNVEAELKRDVTAYLTKMNAVEQSRQRIETMQGQLDRRNEELDLRSKEAEKQLKTAKRLDIISLVLIVLTFIFAVLFYINQRHVSTIPKSTTTKQSDVNSLNEEINDLKSILDRELKEKYNEIESANNKISNLNAKIKNRDKQIKAYKRDIENAELKVQENLQIQARDLEIANQEIENLNIIIKNRQNQLNKAKLEIQNLKQKSQQQQQPENPNQFKNPCNPGKFDNPCAAKK